MAETRATKVPDRLYTMLKAVAAAGHPCPSDRNLRNALAIRNSAALEFGFQELRRQKKIEFIDDSGGRVIRIVETGDTTCPFQKVDLGGRPTAKLVDMWTAEQDTIIRKGYKHGLPLAEIARMSCRTYNQVKRRARVLKIKHPLAKRFAKERREEKEALAIHNRAKVRKSNARREQKRKIEPKPYAPQKHSMERVNFVEEHYKKDMSARKIAEHLGVTTNTVCGIAGRLGLHSKDDSPIVKKEPQLQPRKKKSFWTPARAMEMGAHVRHHTKKLPLKNMHRDSGPTGFRTCQWIDGTPSADDACKCGEPTSHFFPYCDPHLRRAYQQVV